MKQREKLWTPGPWYAIDNGHYFDISTADNQPASCIVNVCASKHLPGGNNEKSNAQLISAAPDLVEALEQMLSQFGGSAIQDMAVTSVLDQAEYAIAKAYGDSQ